MLGMHNLSGAAVYATCCLQAYASGLVDFHLVMDLVPALAAAFFSGKLPATLSPGQAAILLCLGGQQLDIADVDKALDLPTSQVLALFSKVGSLTLPSTRLIFWASICQ